VRIGDHLLLTTLHGDLEYRVREMLVVDPADVWVLDPDGGPGLTLVTCYPFSYVGRAPKRFVVRADRL
jgi:sortase A